MIKKELCFESRSPITNITSISPYEFAFFTKKHGFAVFDIKKSQIVKKIKKDYINIKKATISSNGKLLAIYFKNQINIIDTISTKELKTIYPESEIVTFSFDKNSRYLVTADKSKKLNIYKHTNSTPLVSLTTNTHITNISFFEDEMVLAYKNVYLTKLYELTKLKEVSATNYKVIKTIKLKDCLIKGSKDGSIYINSTKIDTPFTSLNDMLHIGNFLLVAGDLNYITLIDITNKKLLKTSYTSFEDEVKKMCVLDNSVLMVTLKNKQVLKMLLSYEGELNSLVLHNSLDKAYKLVDSDPMLHTTKVHKKLEQRYNELYNQAVLSFQNQNKKQAIQILRPLQNIESKKQEIELVFKSFEHFSKFQKLILTKKYSLAYNLTTKYTPLKQTQPYKKLDEIFKQTFIDAQRQMLLGKKENAKALLNPFINAISKREIIKLILNQSNEFVTFVTATQKNDYKTIKKLINLNPVFKQIPTYQDIQQQIQESLNGIETAVFEMDIYKIRTLLTNLKGKVTTSQIVEFQQTINDITTLKKAYEKDDFFRCFELIDSVESLQKTQLYKLLQTHWQKLMIQCEDKALQGDIGSVKHILGDLINLQHRKIKIDSLLKLSFYIKIKVMLKQKQPNKMEKLIYKYIDSFGEDIEIQKLSNMFEKSFKKKMAITLKL